MVKRFVLTVLGVGLLAIPAFAQKAEATEKAPAAERQIRITGVFGGGYLGVELEEVSQKNFAELGLTEVRGVAVTRVLRNSPAETAGIQKGDVIVAFDGQNVTSVSKFSRMAREVAPDHKVDIIVVRGGAQLTIPVTMGKREPTFAGGNFNFRFPPIPPAAPLPPDGFDLSELMPPPPPDAPDAPDAPRAPIAPLPPAAPDAPDAPRPPRVRVAPGFPNWEGGNFMFIATDRAFGIDSIPLTKQLGEYFGIEDSKGVLVTQVAKGSEAEKAGIRAGDVITEANGKKVQTPFDLIRSQRTDEQNGPIQITIIRDRQPQTVSIERK
ncbi:MAG: PDZ domain-containing protein [Pyrinomonadaceae bacterium]